MLTERKFERLEFVPNDRARLDKSTAQVLDEIHQDRPAAVARRVHVDERTDLNLVDTSVAQQARKLATDEQIDSDRARIRVQDLDRPIPCGEWRITDVSDVIRLMERDDPANLHEGDRLGHDLVGLGNVDQHESRRDEIEFAPWQPRRSRIPMNYLDVPEAPLTDHRSRHPYRIITALDTDHMPRRTDTLGEEVKATVRAAADFNNTRA